MKSSKAKGKVMLAISRLAADQPLHAGILGQWRIVEDSSISTMGVGFRHGRLTLYFCPAFIDSITLDELVGVVEHEALHVILGHVFHEPQPNEHHRARVTAEEVTVNEWVSHPLPCKPILLSAYPSLKSNQSTDDRADHLAKILPEEKVITLDEHSKWAEIIAAGQLAGAVVLTAINRAWDAMTPEQKAKVNLPPSVQKAVSEALKTSGAAAIGEGTATISWRQILRRYVGRATVRRPMFGRVPRRFPELVGIIPATGRSGSKPKVLACIDTSGSMTPALLADISAELKLMSKTHQIIVVEIDNQIRAVYAFKSVLEVHGRGGTDFRPALEADFLRQQKADLVVFFTDGHGPAPAAPPRVPVLWCLTAHGKHPCNWGKVVKMG